MPPRLTRREFLWGFGTAMAGGLSACSQGPDSGIDACSQDAVRPSLRIAHMTDFHVEPRGATAGGMARALRHAMSADPKPDVLINTGDSIMDGMEASGDWAEAQWRLFKEVLTQECDIPTYHCVGNHDVWGWGIDDPGLRADARFGKAMPLEQLGLPHRYYAFDLGAWRFFALDSVHPATRVNSPTPYTGLLDGEQFAWLESELARTPTEQPVCILSHIPLLCVCEFFDGDNEASGDWVVPGAWMHIDARRLKSLFARHPNVRLCLSGHAHQHDRVDYLGVKYLCNGAVSGAWWRGDYLGFPPAYVLVDLYADGSSSHRFVAYDQG